MRCLTRSVKCLLLVCSVILATGGIVIVTTGTMVHATLRLHCALFTDDNVSTFALLLITSGVSLFLVSFLGLGAVLQESRTLLMALGVALLSLAVVQVASLVLLQPSEVGPGLRVAMRDLQRAYVLGQGGARQSWDTLQRAFQCCGTEGPGDWDNVGAAPPPSCRCHGGPGCQEGAWQSGCHPGLAQFVGQAEEALVTSAAVCAGVQVLGALLAVTLARSIRPPRVILPAWEDRPSDLEVTAWTSSEDMSRDFARFRSNK